MQAESKGAEESAPTESGNKSRFYAINRHTCVAVIKYNLEDLAEFSIFSNADGVYMSSKTSVENVRRISCTETSFFITFADGTFLSMTREDARYEI